MSRMLASGGEALGMRSKALEEVLRRFVEEASAALAREVAAGCEIPFELASSPGGRGRGGRRGGGGLCMYRPLPGRFIRERWGLLEGLESCGEALVALEGFYGLDRYLVAHGDRLGTVARGFASAAEEGLVAFAEDVFAEQSDFDIREGRLAEALGRLDVAASSEGEAVTLVATLHGVAISSKEVAMAQGLAIARPDAVSGLPEEARRAVPWPLAGGGDRFVGERFASDRFGGDRAGGERFGGEQFVDEQDHLIVIARAGDDRDSAEAAIGRGEQVLRDLLRALRLFGDSRVTLGPMAWACMGGEVFRPVALASGGRPHGMLVIREEQEDELRAFCNLISRRAPSGEAIAWALRRFEMGCERERDGEGLSDHILGLQALLDPDRSSPGLLAGRVAALCAAPEQRLRTAERVLAALRLERLVAEGRRSLDRAGISLARETAGHLRALLSDLICGHLTGDIRGLADEMLTAEGERGGGESLEGSVDQVGGDLGEGADVLDVLVELGD